MSRPVRLALVFYVVGLFGLEAFIPPGGGNPWNFVFIVCCLVPILVMTIHARRPGGEQPRLFFVDAVVVLYLLYCLVSAAWSVDTSNTVFQTSLLALGWAASVALRTVDVRELARVFLVVALIVAIASFAAILVPGMAFQPGTGELRGVLNHQLRLGMVMSLAVGLGVLSWINGDRSRVLPQSGGVVVLGALLIAGCLIAAYARLYTFFVFLALLLAVAAVMRRWSRVLTVIFVLALIVLIYTNAPTLIALVAGGDPTDTLTGRTVVWARTQIAIDQGTPWGYGFGSFGSDSFASFWGNYRAPHAHNSFLQAQFETGIVGFSLVVLMVTTQVWCAYRVGKNLDRVPYSLFFIAAAGLGSLTGLVYASKPNLLLLVSFLALVCEMQEARRRRAARSSIRSVDRRVPRMRSRVRSPRRETARPLRRGAGSSSSITQRNR